MKSYFRTGTLTDQDLTATIIETMEEGLAGSGIGPMHCLENWTAYWKQDSATPSYQRHEELNLIQIKYYQ